MDSRRQPNKEDYIRRFLKCPLLEDLWHIQWQKVLGMYANTSFRSSPVFLILSIFFYLLVPFIFINEQNLFCSVLALH